MTKRKSVEFAPLTSEQTEALRAYAEAHGRCWKSDLSLEWYRASAPAILHALRNSRGPGWLSGFRLGDAS